MKKIIFAMAVTLMGTAIISCEKPNWNTVRDQVLAMPRDTALMYYWYSKENYSDNSQDTFFNAYFSSGTEKSGYFKNIDEAKNAPMDSADWVWATESNIIKYAQPTSGGGQIKNKCSYKISRDTLTLTQLSDGYILKYYRRTKAY